MGSRFCRGSTLPYPGVPCGFYHGSTGVLLPRLLRVTYLSASIATRFSAALPRFYRGSNLRFHPGSAGEFPDSTPRTPRFYRLGGYPGSTWFYYHVLPRVYHGDGSATVLPGYIYPAYIPGFYPGSTVALHRFYRGLAESSR